MSDFVEPRERIKLPPTVVDMFASRRHRLIHAVWHGVRDLWESPTLDSENDARRKRIDELNWAPKRPSLHHIKGETRPALVNGSGEDFLFMHREMIAMFDAAIRDAGQDPDLGWVNVPQPGVAVESGYEVAPAWELPGIPTLQRRFESLKTDTYFWSRMRWWDREFKAPAFLKNLTLGELGSMLETSIHNDMHMRWAAQPKDPITGELLVLGRPEYDIDPKWDTADYDFLGETYSSHVNPVFWRLHKWVDDRIGDWQRAHEAAHPGEILNKKLDGVDWFEPGKWVLAGDPWSGPVRHEHSHHVHHEHPDPVAIMEEVMGLVFPTPASDKHGFVEDITDGAGTFSARNIIGAI